MIRGSLLSGRSGISPMVTVGLLILISIAVAIATYLVISGYITIRETATGAASSVIRIDAFSCQGRLLKLYISNQGGTKAEVSSVYYEDSKRVIRLRPPVFGSGTAEVWGGDVWAPDPYTLRLAREVSGRLISDDFTAKNTTVWDYDYVDYNNVWSAIYNDPDGLKLLSKSDGGWAVRGVVTRNSVNFSKQLVIIVDLMKTNYNVPRGDAAGFPFAACLYIAANEPYIDASYVNPYYNVPWIALKLYPRYIGGETLTEAQLVARDSSGTVTWVTLHTWYPSPDTEPRIKAVLVFNESSKVYYYAWIYNGDEFIRYISGSWTNSVINDLKNKAYVYIYLTIDNRVTESSRKVHVRYLRISGGTNVTIKNIERGWWVRVRDLCSGGEVMVESNGTVVNIPVVPFIIENIENGDRGLPLNASIAVFVKYPVSNSVLASIPPGAVGEVLVSLPSDAARSFLIKVLTSDGSQTAITVSRIR